MGNKKVLSKATRELNKTKRVAAPKNIIEDPRGQWAHPGEITRIPSDRITMQGVPYPVMAYPNMGEPQMMYPEQEYYFPNADYVDEYPQMQEGGTNIPIIEDAGSMNEDGFWVPDWETMAMQAKQLNAKTVKTRSGAIIYFDNNWQVQSVDENPQMRTGGTPKSLVKMPKPSKKGLASKKFSRSLEATNRLFTEHPLFAKPKSKKRKVFDPNAQYQEGGDPGDKFKQRLMKRYPGMQGVYGPQGENLAIVRDPNYDARSVGYGDIEFAFPGDDPVLNYPNLVEEGAPDYNYPNPSPDTYTALYNPRGANRGDIFLDMMHGMRDDPNYQPLLQNFEKAVRDTKGGDMGYYYDEQVKKGYKGSQEQWDANYLDGQLRAQLAPGSIGMFSHGRKDYRLERKYDSPEMRAAAKDIRNYLKGKPTKEDYIETELTPEEIEEYKKGGFIVEELDTYPKGGEPDPKTQFYTVEGSGGVYRKVNGKWEVDWNRSGNFQPITKGDVKARTAVLEKKAKPLYDATYDDLYTTQQSAYTAQPKPKSTSTKKSTTQNKTAQEQFDKNFQVTGKSKMEVVEDKIQKGINDYAKYHQEQTGKPLTQEEYNDAYQDIYNRAYVDAGTYKPSMSGPVTNPYGTTELRKNLISLDPGKAPKNLTLGDYVNKGWDIVSNPLDYASYALRPKGTVTTPWNMTNYENRLEAAGLEDPITANNNVSKAIDFATYFTPIGAAAQGLKMIPGTAYSIGKAFEEPSWENAGDALFNTGMAALTLAPGFGYAKNLGKGASSIDDLKAIEALKGNTANTPFQSYYLTGNRALNASEGILPQAEGLRRFTGQQLPELPEGRLPVMSQEVKSELTNPAVDSYFPLRYGDEPYAAAGNEMYHYDPEDFTVWNEATKKWEVSPDWKKEATGEFNWIWDDAISKKLKPLNPGKSDNLGPWEFSQFSPGWEALQEAKGYLAGPQRMPRKSDYLTDNEFFKLMSQEMKYNILDDERKIQEAILGRKISDAEFAEMNPGIVRPDFTQKMLTEEQRKIVNDLLSDNPSVKSNPLLRENLQKLLDQNIGDVKATPRSSRKPFRSGDLPMSLNSAPEILPKGKINSKNPLDQLAALIKRRRSRAEMSALDDLSTIRLQSKTGQANAEELLNAEIEQKLEDLDTPEGRRRVQKYIEDNNLVNEEYDPGNFNELAKEYAAELPRILADKYSDESQRIVELVRNNMIAKKRSPQLMANIKSWNELEAEHILNNPLLKMQAYEAIVPADPRYTGGTKTRPFTHDEYVEKIENILYKDVSQDIERIKRSIQVSENEIKQLATEKNLLNRDLRSEEDLSMRQIIQKRVKDTNRRILDAHNRIAFNKQSMNTLNDYLNRENAGFQAVDNTISLGDPYTSIGDILPTIVHEMGHGTEMVGNAFGNSAIDRALIKNLTFRKKAPGYLYKKFDPDKARETSPSHISKQGIEKYRDPEGYYTSSLNYFKAGNKLVVGDSNEPTAFAVEMRPALKELGLIKGNYDIVTPEMLEKLYVEYTTNPKFQFRDLRIFDIIEPNKENFKELAKNYNDIKSLLPYAVPVGLGVGATSLADQEEMQQDMEYQDGGIIMELSDDEIQEYANGGFVVEELDYKPDAGKVLNKKVVTTPKPSINTTGLAYKPNVSAKVKSPNPKASVQTTPKSKVVKSPPILPPATVESMSSILEKYDVGNTSPIMTTDVFQSIIDQRNQEKQAKLQKLQRQLDASQRATHTVSEQPVIKQYEFNEEFIEGMPNVRTEQSASYLGGRPLKNEVRKVVLHHTGTTDEKNNNKYVHNHFMNPKSETSAHIVIEEDGTRTIYASPDQVTFHAGKSSWDGRDNVNDFGVGVEFQGDTNVKPLTSAQIRSFVEYFDQLAKQYNVTTKDIITHAMIAPGRKPDITESEYKRILKYLTERGYK